MDAITYYGEEKILNLICILLGSLSLIFSLIFLGIIKYSFFKGMAVPLLVFGSLQLITGLIVYNRTCMNEARVEQAMQQYPESVKTEELQRIQPVLKNFTTYKWVEIALMAFGIVLYLKFYRSTSTFWKGVGLGLLLQAGISLGLDTVAEKKAEQYIQFLKSK